MKKIMALLLMTALLLSSAALAEEYVSVSELYEQAQLMGGVWQETFDTPNGEVTIDAPIIVPQISEIPVITVESAKPLTQVLYDTIVQGRKTTKSKAAIQYEAEIDGTVQEFFLGYEENGLYGYDAVNCAWIQRGDYRFDKSGGAARNVKPKTCHYPWELDFDQAYVRGSDQTIGEMMALWQKDIELCYPDGEYVVKPKRIYLHGSLLSEETGEGKKYTKDGDCFIYGEQYFFDLPLIGAMGSCDGENKLWINHGATPETNRAFDRMAPYCMGSCGECYNQNRFLSANNTDNRSMNDLNKVRSIEYEDIPLAPLVDVLASIEKEIRAGYISEVFAIRLGYVMYSNPEMTDYAWAVPRWVVDCNYITEENKAIAKRFHERDDGTMNIWNTWEFAQIPVDAQSAEMIIFSVPTEEILRVPEIIAWDDTV